MPFYEYQCAACGHHHEELQKVSDRPLRKCPACGRTTLRRLVSAPVFRLKGGGWYETDFKSDQEGKRNLAGENEPAAEKPKAEPAAGAAPDAAAKSPDASQPKAADQKPKPAPRAAKRATRNRAKRR